MKKIPLHRLADAKTTRDRDEQGGEPLDDLEPTPFPAVGRQCPLWALLRRRLHELERERTRSSPTPNSPE